MTWREDRLHEGALIEDLSIRLEHGTLVLPAGTRLNVVGVVSDPQAFGITAAPPPITVEYRVLLVADGIRLTSRMEIRRG